MTTIDRSADQAAITSVLHRITEAWAAHDGDAFARVFTENGTMILPGVFRKGQADIRAFMTQAFAGPYQGTQVTGQPIDLEVHGNTAVVISKGGVLAPGETEVSEARAIRATWVVVKDDGEWRLTAYQNSPVHAPGDAA
ncbi:MAG: SgcJ/EcaC family oxidoreductase [Actinophytocola sp.]|uniref:SgcJ/EcaC family oxidoreductase n=1 Tax=Actinophytocola sp. TaxID=1872138 RepID=UPI001329B088|nr:SgcJ/EcaC family oxidoreductase [Actinophytocola sp.]MPZ85174.1 SgcJ/EcaC family oxidoreductase [Actinophytocola sp.]